MRFFTSTPVSSLTSSRTALSTMLLGNYTCYLAEALKIIILPIQQQQLIICCITQTVQILYFIVHIFHILFLHKYYNVTNQKIINSKKHGATDAPCFYYLLKKPLYIIQGRLYILSNIAFTKVHLSILISITERQ